MTIKFGNIPSDTDIDISTGGIGITDHGSLTGLGDDDHTQYLNNARGDARYQPIATVLTNTTASFTTAQETKLAGIAAGAEVNVNADWNATSGDAEILNKPTIPSVLPTFTAGLMLFGDGDNVPNTDSNLFWDNTTKKLGVGTASPTTAKLVIADTALAGSGSLNGGALAISQTWNTTGSPSAILLDVTNTARGASSALLNLRIGGVTKIRVDKEGSLTFGPWASAPAIYNGNPANGGSLEGGAALLLAHYLSGTTTGYGIWFGRVTGTRQATSGESGNLRFTDTFNPTSGTGVYNAQAITPTINQTGGANGITRGLYVNPTLTAAANWRGIELGNTTGFGIYQTGSSVTNYYAGNIAIGVTSASAKLDIVGAGATSATNTFEAHNSTGSSNSLIIKDDGNVGVGLSTPSSYYAKKLVVSAIDEEGITIASTSTSGANYLAFADGTTGNAAYRGYIVYRHSSDSLGFATSGSERLRIDSVGNVGIGTSSPNASSLLDITSTTKGFLPPRMTTTERNAISSPARGLLVYDTTLGKLCVRGAAAWETITSI